MKQVKGWKQMFISLTAGALLLSGCGSSATTQSGTSGTEASETYQVGYTNFFTGKQAAMGKIVDASVNIALEEFNSSAKVPIELLAEDIGDTPVTAKNGYEKLLANDPPALLTFISSSNFVGVSALLENEKIPVVLSNTLGSIFEHGWDWVFGTQTPGSMEAPLAIEYYHEKLGKNKIAVLVANDDAGKSVVESLEPVAKEKNITIIPEFFNLGDNDYTANITSARRQNPDMYYVNTPSPSDLAKVIKQMRQLGIQEPISVNNYIANADFNALLTPQEAEGLYGYTSSYVNLEDPKVQEFSKKFKEKSGLDADPTSLFVYDGAMIMFNAVEQGGGDKQKILEALRATEFTGLSAVYKFDAKGRGRKDTNIMQIGPDRTFKFLENVKYTKE